MNKFRKNRKKVTVVSGTIFSGKLTMERTDTAVPRKEITCASDAYEVFSKFWDWSVIELKEDFHMLLLNRSNVVVGHVHVSSGGSAGTIADGKLIFATALQKCVFKGLIFCHNHPSGNLKASEADIKLTKNLSQFGKMIGIQVLDHLIITADGFLSMANEGIGF